ncbi:RNA-binding S4 domain-containing protein [soil metagenome]
MGQRIDRWLWFARFVKTRPLAAGLVESGRVRLNGRKITKPGHDVRQGDVVTFAYAGRVQVFEILGCADRRGPAPQARLLYRNLDRSDAQPAASENGLQNSAQFARERSE